MTTEATQLREVMLTLENPDKLDAEAQGAAAQTRPLRVSCF